MLSARFAWFCLFATPLALAQAGSRVALEPLEFSGSPRPTPQLTSAGREMGDVLNGTGDDNKTLASLRLLDRCHPDYADACSRRAYITMCLAPEPDLDAVKSDIDAARSHGGGRFFDGRDSLLILGEIAFLKKDYTGALDRSRSRRDRLVRGGEIFGIDGVNGRCRHFA
jgi:hypothetical protein